MFCVARKCKSYLALYVIMRCYFKKLNVVETMSEANLRSRLSEIREANCGKSDSSVSQAAKVSLSELPLFHCIHPI